MTARSTFVRTCAIAAGITVGACLSGALLYGCVYFAQHPTSASLQTENPDAVACRAKGGFAVYSNWSGQMIECRPLVKQ